MGKVDPHSRPDPPVRFPFQTAASVTAVGSRSHPAPWGGWGGLVDLSFVLLSFVCLYFVILYLVVCGFPYLENPYLENPYAVNPLAAPRPLTGCLFAAGGGRGGFWREFAPICPQIAQRRL